jgi:hypothetical protein
MSLMLDTNVLLDILTADPKWLAWSTARFREASATGPVPINPIIYAELAAGFDSRADLDHWLQPSRFKRLPLPYEAGFRAARAYLYHCAWRVTQGHDIVQDVSLLKALTGELVNEVTQGCQQVFGGMGYMRGMAIERLWRDARILAIGGGATEVMLDEAAKRY